MKSLFHQLSMVATMGAAFLSLSTLTTCQTGSTTSDWKQVEEAMGRPGQMQPEEVIRFGMPRKDLHVVLDGVEIKAGLALGSWAAFKRDGSEAMVMGDLVLTENEVEPVMMKLQEGGIQESALHNHLLGESPHVIYMHIASHCDPVRMAKAIREATVGGEAFCLEMSFITTGPGVIIATATASTN